MKFEEYRKEPGLNMVKVKVGDRFVLNCSHITSYHNGDLVEAVQDTVAPRQGVMVRNISRPHVGTTMIDLINLTPLALTLDSLVKKVEEAKVFIQETEEKINWMKANGSQEFNAQEFAVYKVIEKLEDSKLTPLEKSRFIVDILKLK